MSDQTLDGDRVPAAVFILGMCIFLGAAVFGIILLFVESAIWGCAGTAALGALMIIAACNAP